MDKLLFRNDGFCFLMTASKLIPGMHWFYMGLCAIVHILMVTGKTELWSVHQKLLNSPLTCALLARMYVQWASQCYRPLSTRDVVLIASLVYQSSPRISNLGLSCFPCKKSKCSLFSLWGLYRRHIPLVEWNDYMC